jgi:hypothetical protein
VQNPNTCSVTEKIRYTFRVSLIVCVCVCLYAPPHKIPVWEGMLLYEKLSERVYKNKSLVQPGILVKWLVLVLHLWDVQFQISA